MNQSGWMWNKEQKVYGGGTCWVSQDVQYMK